MSLSTNPLLKQAPFVLNVGIDGFNDSITAHGGRVQSLRWQPPGDADPVLAWLRRIIGEVARETMDLATASRRKAAT